MIARDAEQRLRTLAAGFPVVVLTGPRQSGKSTLCRMTFPDKAYVGLEAPDTRAFAFSDPRGFLSRFPDGAVIDEIQRVPELASYLQERVDAESPQVTGRWVLTGSQNPAVMQSTSQSLAGRAGVMHLLPLTRGEVERFPEHPRTLMASLVAGSYPRVFDRGLSPGDFYGSYVATYLERDVRMMLNVGDLAVFQRFMQLVAGRTGQLLNLSALASDAGITQPTARSWLSVLEASFLVMRLPPFHGNLTKRLTKSPKLHFIDVGLACWLMGIRTVEQLDVHPLRGAVFESYVVSEVLKARMITGETMGLFHYRDQAGLEADLIVESGSVTHVLEMKSGQTTTPEMAVAARRVANVLRSAGKGSGDLRDVRCCVVHGGEGKWAHEDVTFVPWIHAARLGESEGGQRGGSHGASQSHG